MDAKDYIIKYAAGNLYWKNTNSVYLGCNENMARILKLSSPEEVIGKNDYDFNLDKQFVNAIVVNDQIVMRSGIEQLFEEVGINVEGELALYLTKKAPLRDDENNIIGLIGTSIDITKQKEAELAKNKFIENMKHSLRTPFYDIIKASELLYTLEVDSVKKEQLNYILQSSKILLNTLNDIIGSSNVSVDDQQLKWLRYIFNK